MLRLRDEAFQKCFSDKVAFKEVYYVSECKMLYYNGVKGTGPLAEGSEGRQSLPFYTNTGMNATWYEM